MSQSSVIAGNLIDVAPERQQELLDLLHEGADQVFGPLQGFETATIFASLDGSRVLYVARWESMEAVKAVQANPEVAAFGPRVAAIGTSSPSLYRVASTHGK